MTNHNNAGTASVGEPQVAKSKVECKRLRLAEAISDARLYQTKVILEDNPNLNYLDQDGLSPLMRAFLIDDARHRSRSALVKLLIQHKADVNLRDRDQRHALTIACQMNRLDLVKILFTHCLQDIDMTAQDRNGNTPLMYAVLNNNLVMVRLIVNGMRKFSLSVDQRNTEDKTAYYQAVELGFQECAQILADVGRASQAIQVNPFLDFSVLEKNTDYLVRGNGAATPSVNTRDDNDICVIKKRAKTRRIGVFRIPDSLTRKGFASKKRGAVVNRAHQTSRKTEKSKSSKNDENLNTRMRTATKEKSFTLPLRENKRSSLREDKYTSLVNSEIKAKQRFTRSYKENEAEKESSLRENTLNYCAFNNRNTNDERCKNNGPRRHLLPSNQDRFLRLILDEGPGSDEGRKSRSPILSISPKTSRSVSPLYNEKPSIENAPKPAINNFLKCTQRQESYLNVPRTSLRRCTTSVSEYGSTKSEPKYSAYSVWKDKVNDYPPNSIRRLLALRAEQQDETSSFRKGLVLPKYEPSPSELAKERPTGEVLSTTSEKSTKSEATKKVIVAAKSIGISSYMANKRKGLSKKD